MIDETLARLAVSLSMDASQFSTGSTSVQKEMQKLAGAVTGLGDKWMQAGKRLTIGVSTPLAAFGLLSAKTASDAQELESAFSQTFGDLSDTMTDWARVTGDAMGRSTQSMQEMANTFGIFFNQAAPTRQIAAEMSKTFTVLAQDLSSFFNVTESDALAKLRSGLAGESEPLRDFGVFLNEATVKAKAMEMGLGGLTGELTEQEKILARYEIILEKTTDAQGDVIRTSDGAANQARAFSGALEELQVVIGKKLLPLLVPLIEGATKLLNSFTNLPAPIQNIIIGAAALAAAMGPLMLIMGTLAVTLLPLFAARFGPIGLAISAFLNPLGTAISLIAQFALSLGGLTILKTIGAFLAGFAVPLAAVAAGGALIYKEWDRIAPLLEQFWETIQQALGPPLQELIGTITATLSDLWSSGFGEGLRTAGNLLSNFASLVADLLGDQIVMIITALGVVVSNVFELIGGAITVIVRLLQGDFAGAWQAVLQTAQKMVENFLRAIETAFPQAGQYLRQVYQEARAWLQDKLGAVFDWVGKKIQQVTGFFQDMYIAVVGNSYVPDMVDEIGAHMARLDALMVNPARKAAQNTEDAMRDMARRVRGILADLYPEVEEAERKADRIATLREGERKGILTREQAKDAIRREQGIEQGPLVDFKKQAESVPDIMGDVAAQTEIQTVRIAQSFAEMAQNSIRSVEGLVNSIKGGGFLDILGGAVNLFLQLGSSGVFGGNVAGFLNTPRIPGNAQGTNNWRGGLSWVGERGPELVNLPRGSQVISNRALKASNDAGGNVRVTVDVDDNGNLRAFVDGQIASHVSAIASAGASLAQAQMMQTARRRAR